MSAFTAPGFLDIQTFLGAPQLTKAVKARNSGTPKPLPASFYTSKPADGVIRNVGAYQRTYGTQQNARTTGYGSAARETEQVAKQMVPFVCIHAFEKLPIKMTDYVGLIQPSSTGASLEVDETGMNYIAGELGEFQTRFTTLRNTITGLTLANDAVYMDANGNVLPSSSGSLYTIQSGILPSHQGQLNNGSVSIIDTSWANPAADIPKMIRLLMRQAAEDFAGDGPNLEYAIYGKNVPSYLFNNVQLQQYLKFNEQHNVQYIAEGKVPDSKLIGLKWIDATNMFFRQAPASTAFNANAIATNTNSSGILAPGDGTANAIFGDDLVVFCAEPAKVDWWKVFEGNYPVPQNMPLSGSPMEMVGRNKLMRGMFAYAGCQLNPPGIDIYVGDTFYPAITAPNAIYQATVAFGS